MGMFVRTIGLPLSLSLLLLSAGTRASSGTACLYDASGAPRLVAVAGADTPIGAVSILASPPFGYTSAIPAGTQVNSLTVGSDAVSIDFSGDIVAGGIDESRLESVYEQVRITLSQFSLPGVVRITASGIPLYSYLPPEPEAEPGKQPAEMQASASASLSGRKISLSPGHGQVWIGSYWGYERPVTCAPLLREDDHNNEIMRYLDAYLRQDGATTKVYRCLDKNLGDYTNGTPWWKMSAAYWLKQIGYPCSVYAYSTGDCTLGSGASEVNDQIMSRPLAADYDNTDIHVSLHSNALSGDCFGSTCPNGTVTYYDNSSTHATWGAISLALAQNVQTGIVNSIRTHYTDSTWRDRGALDSDGGFAETRVPNRAAILIELAFHDSCDRDALYLRDNFFRSTTMWGVYKGICDYFGVAPTYGYYSYTVVGDDIPITMSPGEVRTVHITLLNTGVLWNEAHQFRLGALGDSDPFTSQTRYTVSGDVEATQTATFTLTLTAPTTPGTYRTDWRMVRESVTWFGPTVQKDIVVVPPGDDTQPPTVPANLGATAAGTTQINLAWSASTDNYGVAGYRVYRDDTMIGTSSTTSYQDTGLISHTTYSYQISAYDSAGNESARSGPVSATTSFETEYILDEDQAVKVSSWNSSTTSGYAGDYIWGSSTVEDLRSAKWTPNLQVSGYYDVYVWWVQGTNRSTVAPYTVSYYGGSVEVQADQTQNGSQWNLLASNLPFAAGATGYVILNSGTGVTGTVLVADAVRFVYRSALDVAAPSVPGGLTATAVGASQINLAWSASTDDVGVTSYKIYRGGALLATTTGTAYQNTGLADLTTYSYEVSACDAAGNESAKSNTATATTPDGTAPTIPGSLTATAVSPSQIDLSWGASTDNVGVTVYRIYRGGVFYATAAGTSYQNTGLPGSTTFSYQVSACDAAGNESGKSSTATATTEAPPDTTPPTVSSVTASPAMIAGGYPVTITVVATDNVGVTEITAPGVASFALGGDNTWTGSLPADPSLGLHNVTVVIKDAAGNQNAGSASYTTAPLLAAANSAMSGVGVMQLSASTYVFKVWGSVTYVDANRFTVNDGSNSPVLVFCPSHNLTTGRLVAVVGAWNCGTSPPRIESQVGQVQILQ